MTIDKDRVKALEYLSAYITYKKWYIRFLYEFRDGLPINIMGVLAGDRIYFEKMGGVGEEFFAEQEEIRAKATARYVISDEAQADELMSKILEHFDWHMLEFFHKEVNSCGIILGKKEFLAEANSIEAARESETEKEAPKAERPKLKEEAFVNEKGVLLYWN